MTIARIVVGTDFSDPAEVAVQHALALAKFEGADLTMLHAHSLPLQAQGMYHLSSLPELYFRQVEDLQSESRARLEKTRASLADQGVSISLAFVEDPPAEGLARVAEEREADVVVVGSHGRSGVSRLVLGSVSEAVLRTTRSDVLIARQPAPIGGYPSILVPTDFSVLSEKALQRALELVAEGGTIELLHCWEAANPLSFSERYAEDLRTRLRTRALDTGCALLAKYRRPGLHMFSSEAEGDPRHCIAEYAVAGEHDLIAMGTHGRRGLQRLIIGSVAESILRHVDLPIYLVHQPAGEDGTVEAQIGSEQGGLGTVDG